MGHIEETSLPIGGASTHSVLASHTGLSKAKMFDDINKLEKNDYFIIHILNKNLKYEIIDKKVVLPYEISSLMIEKDKDLVTLVTCTPKYKNTHRLLITGSRVNLEEKIDIKPTKIEEDYVYVNNKKRIFIAIWIFVFYIDLFFIIFKFFRVLPLK